MNKEKEQSDVLDKEQFNERMSRRKIFNSVSSGIFGFFTAMFVSSFKTAKAQTWQPVGGSISIVGNRVVTGTPGTTTNGYYVSDVTLESVSANQIRLAVSYLYDAGTVPVACFPPGTLIRKHDGSLSAIEEIKEGDVLISHDGSPTTVEKTKRHDLGDQALYNVSGLLQTTAGHLLWSTDGWSSIKTEHFYEISTNQNSYYVNSLSNRLADKHEQFSVTKKISKALRPGTTLKTILNENIKIDFINIVSDTNSHDPIYNLYTCKGSFVLGNGIIVDGLNLDS